MNSPSTPPGYAQMPQWLADVMEPLSEEAKDLAKRAFDVALEEAKKHDAVHAEGAALGAMVGICVQRGLAAIGKSIELQPLQRADNVANYMAGEIRASTLITFVQMVTILNQAATTETKQ